MVPRRPGAIDSRPIDRALSIADDAFEVAWSVMMV